MRDEISHSKKIDKPIRKVMLQVKLCYNQTILLRSSSVLFLTLTLVCALRTVPTATKKKIRKIKTNHNEINTQTISLFYY